MKRHKFKTKNQLYVHRYLFIIMTMVILTIVFLVIGNLGLVASRFNLEKKSVPKVSLGEFTSLDETQRKSIQNEIQPAKIIGNDAPSVVIYDTKNDNVLIETQMMITKQPYTVANAIESIDDDVQLIIVHTDTLSSKEVNAITDYVNSGVSVLFVGIPGGNTLENRDFQELLGIKNIIGETSWKGVRTSSDLLTGSLVEKPKYEASGLAVELTGNIKVYACGLPEKYWEIKNEDLPPIIWRHIQTGETGRVYVFNGDFAETEMGYGIVSLVLGEINKNYLYPVVNAYCVSVSGYPYADNETRDSWQRLYSRDKMLIQQDMLTSQLKRCVNNYGIRITCFSPDYEIFKNTDDISLQYYSDEIETARGLLAKQDGDRLVLDEKLQGLEIDNWSKEFTFWNEKTGEINLPICFNSTVDDVKAEEFAIAGFASTMGYFAVNIDYENFLNYEGEEDVWTLYSSYQEVMFGTQRRDYGWLERVTMDEAFARVLQLLKMDIDIEYEADCIEVSIDNFNENAWFVLRSDMENIEIDHGTIEEIGRNCYFVTIDEPEARISWEG